MADGEENDSACLDTVGAIVVDQEGNVAAAVSSGGLAMKHPGRVGQVKRDLRLILCKIWSGEAFLNLMPVCPPQNPPLILKDGTGMNQPSKKWIHSSQIIEG